MSRREKLLARTRAIKVLNYAMQTEEGSDACERFVEVQGLKTFFAAFMGKVSELLHPFFIQSTASRFRFRFHFRFRVRFRFA
jgi:hypothetical protein